MIGGISKIWVKWIQDSYNRGCSIEQTREILLKHFEVADVDIAIQSVWTGNPPIETFEINFAEPYIDTSVTSYGSASVTILHTNPLVAQINNLLTEEQCSQLIALGTEMRRARVVSSDDAVVSKWRTNDAQPLTYNHCPETVYLEKKLEEITRIPLAHGERLQLLHYKPGQYYKPHNDWFHINNSVTNMTVSGQRVATCVTYLNDVTKGGETYFPKLGIRVSPQAGSAVYFEYTDRQGRTTSDCLHSSEPVIQGEKWVLTKWLRQRPIVSEEDLGAYK